MLDLAPADWVTLAGTVVSLVFLEGLLSADNALVLAVMVRHLPRTQQKRALRYGIAGAFVFRLIAVLLASQILDYWQFEVVGGLYLLYLALKHLIFGHEETPHTPGVADAVESGANLLTTGVDPSLSTSALPTIPGAPPPRPRASSAGFWKTVIGVELTDIAFSVDSILAAVAMADGMPKHLQKIDFGIISLEGVVIYLGGILGIITMRYVAGYFLQLLERFPGLAQGAYYLVGWIGLKLIGSGLHHALYHGKEELAEGWPRSLPVPEFLLHHLEMPSWFFWAVMLSILTLSMLLGPRRQAPAEPVTADRAGGGTA